MGTKRTRIKKVKVPHEVGIAFIQLNSTKPIADLEEILGWTKKAVKDAVAKIVGVEDAIAKIASESIEVETPPNPAAPMVVKTKESILPEHLKNKTVISTPSTSEAADALPRAAQVNNDPARVHIRKK